MEIKISKAREEEIKQEELQTNSTNSAYYQIGFFNGAIWADKTMLDKVGEWLRNNSYMMDNWDEDKCYIAFDFTSKDEMIKEFHKTMKGGEE